MSDPGTVCSDSPEGQHCRAKVPFAVPPGPHSRAPTMCPTFGALRVGLRMRRTASLLCGSACCVYGLSFTAHFYGARRTIGYLPFNSETLVTGKVFEDMRDAVEQMADPERYDVILVTNLCVPSASGVPLERLPKQINGVRVVGLDIPGFGVGTHAEAKDVLSSAMLRYARQEAELGPVMAPRGGVIDKPTVTLLGEIFPADPMSINAMIAPMDLAVGPTVPVREWRELYSALDCAVCAAVHPHYTGAVREFQTAGRPVVGSAPVGYEGTAEWLEAIGVAAGVARERIDATKNAILPPIREALSRSPLKARITLSGYEGSEFLVARLLIESGAEIPYVSTAVPATPWSGADRAWLESKGVIVATRASLEQDVGAVEEFKPDLAIGTTPVVQKAKELAIPALYFTNLISARPLFGIAGTGSLAPVILGAVANKGRFETMKRFFAGVGSDNVAEV